MSNADSISPLRQSVQRVKAASRRVAAVGPAKRTATLKALAAELRNRTTEILAANALDMAAGKEKGLEPSFMDRLFLDESRVEAMAVAVEEIAAQEDPIGALESQTIRPNGLRVGRMRIPLGVICVIYEARPNVTSDAAALALRAGNAMILKGGRDARHSNRAIGDAVAAALTVTGLPADAVMVITDTGRDEMAELLRFDEEIDLVIPRGGEGLIRFVAENSRIPVVKHYKGVCHVYVDKAADVDMAAAIAVNGKSRPSVCNSVETVLVHRDIAAVAVPAMVTALQAAGVTVHGCAETAALASDIVPADESDWLAEYLSLDVAMKVVDDIEAAIEHIAQYGSNHTEAIISESISATQQFTREVLSSCVMINASTRFADGGQLGLGAEIGISTSKVHAYGPMGAEGLTTTRFLVVGEGQTRT